MDSKLNRRAFVKTSAAITGSVAASSVIGSSAFADPKSDDDISLKGRIYKTLKINMIQSKGSLTEKFKAAKKAGFVGVEMNSPGMSVDETRKAIGESGLPVDGTVCSTHWAVRHTSPDAKIREQALKDLQTSIRDTHAVGGNTALLVIGSGKDGPEKEIWPRAIENISKALPLLSLIHI